MFCTTECWSCEDKSCEHYIDKTKLYFECNRVKTVLTKLEECLKEKIDAINYLKETLGQDVKILNPDIDGIDMAYKDICEKIVELKKEYNIK